MIYIDPPYNTGNDFIYPDDYTESLALCKAWTRLKDRPWEGKGGKGGEGRERRKKEKGGIMYLGGEG